MNRSLVALLLVSSVALAAPVPKAKDDGKLLVLTGDNKATLHTFDGKDPKVMAEVAPGGSLRFATLSPDGKRVAFGVILPGMDGDTAIRLRAVADDKPTELVTIPGGGKNQLLPRVSVSSLFWSPDGKTLAGTFHDRFAKQKPPALSGRWTNFSIDAATGERTDLQTNTEYRAVAFTADGKGFVCTRGFEKPSENNKQMIGFETAVTPTGKVDPQVVIADPLGLQPVATFPDDKRWVVTALEESTWKVGVYTAGEKQPAWWDAEVKDTPIPVAVGPDGRRVVYALNPVWKQVQNDKVVLWVADADGKNAAKLWESNARVLSIDWR